MPLKKHKPVTPGTRQWLSIDYSELSKDPPEKKLLVPLHRRAGRNNQGRVTAPHRRNAYRGKYRLVDFKRSRDGEPAKVVSLQYDPNRTAFIALIEYPDGTRSYIIAPHGIKVGDVVQSGEDAPIRPGNTLPLARIPDGTLIHNIELIPGRGAQLVRAAGSFAQLMAKELEKDRVVVRLPSGEMRYIHARCRATVGRVSNVDNSNQKLGKAGRSFHRGRRPHVRGAAMNAVDHPHGGGEGKAGTAMPPQSRTGVYAKGKKTRSPRKSLRHLVRDRRVGR